MHVAFRVDASRSIGTGHVVRCLTLARLLREGGASCQFIMRELDGHLLSTVAAAGFPSSLLPAPSGGAIDLTSDVHHAGWLEVAPDIDARETVEALNAAIRADWLVLDHYALDARWEAMLRPYCERLMVIDDLADRHHECDLLLDQNLNRRAEDYESLVPSRCRLLIGPEYALLRPEFSRGRAALERRSMVAAQRALVYFGGADLGGMTLRALQAVEAACGGSLAVDTVMGMLNPHVEVVTAWCLTRPWCRLHVGDIDMAHLMATADFAIGAAGTTAWERCCLGLPSIVVVIAENQAGNAEALARTGAALHVGNLTYPTSESLAAAIRVMVDQPELRRHIAEISSLLVDGRGAVRTAAKMQGSRLQLRRAKLDDCRSIWIWRNAEQTRRYSRDPVPVTFATHEQWFKKSLALGNRDLLIAEENGAAVAVVRFDVDANSTAEISLYVVPGHESRGIGLRALTESMVWLAANRPQVLGVRAEVLADNEASRRIFLSAGFRLISRSYYWKVQS